MGLPAAWSIILGWLLFRGVWVSATGEQCNNIKYKCPELPVLNNYSRADNEFWGKFPSEPLRKEVKSTVSVGNFVSLVEKYKGRLTPQQKARADRVTAGLRNGMSSHQLTELPPVVVPNARNTLQYGRQITDQIAHWVKSGFASGPFKAPPLDRFRVNCLMAVPQDGKIRPVLNVSAPLGASLNDNIDKLALEKIKMSSAREFGYLLVRCGERAVMSKADLCDAYKLIPIPLSELRLQGFCWMDRYFIENCQIFGAGSAPSNFDQFNHSIVDFSVIESTINPDQVLRHLDDVLSASPAKSDKCRLFTEEFCKIADKVNVKLQAICQKNEKAFKNSTVGKVLGIWFYTEDLSWSLPDEKNMNAWRK